MAIIKVITPSVTDANITTAKVTDNAITLAKMASGTDGNIISYDASGNPVAIATGSDGQVLTSTGAGSPPAFEAIPGGGKIGQVVSTAKVDHFSTSSSSFTDITGLTVNITPSASNSKIYVMTNFMGGSDSGSGYPAFRMLRGSTVINAGTLAGTRVGGFLHMNIYNADNDTGMSISTAFLDSPNTTSETTYKIQAKQSGGNIVRVGAGGNDNDNAQYVRSASIITVMEVLA
jgi:hypothetical protein